VSKLRRLNGQPADDTDGLRGVWYSSRCRYWTDDWSKLKLVGPGIPVCPHCNSVGFQAEYENFSGKDEPKERCNEYWHTKQPGVPSISHFLPPGS
jgi:hypothetical protein